MRPAMDATNDFEPSDHDRRTSSEGVAGLVRGARVVKVANTLAAAVLGSDQHEAEGWQVTSLSGEDLQANADVIWLFDGAGFSTIDLGDLTTGRLHATARRPARWGEPDPALWSELAVAIRLTGSKDSTVRTA
jgi:predicted dinucleotide-binding enzyme